MSREYESLINHVEETKRLLRSAETLEEYRRVESMLQDAVNGIRDKTGNEFSRRKDAT